MNSDGKSLGDPEKRLAAEDRAKDEARKLMLAARLLEEICPKLRFINP